MKYRGLIIMAILVLTLGALGTYRFISRDRTLETTTVPNNPVMMADKDQLPNDQLRDDQLPVDGENPAMMGEATTPETAGRYTTFSPDLLDSTKNRRRVLFFYANWCPTCQPADTSFATNADQIPSDVTILRVNYNDTDTDQAEKDLAQKYGVTYQHTFVQIDASGNVVTKWNGGQIAELLKNLK